MLARQAGHQVSGSDTNVYPPMSTQLEALDISLHEGYRPEHLQPAPDLVVIGNALSRGNPAVEHVLNRGLSYISGPQWLQQDVLHDSWVLAVAGTHGKTTTASMLAWMLEYAGMSPGFLIGGVPGNFNISARNGGSPFFVVEADEYDSAFFDKRSKFVHYRPRTLVLNNLEFDHADIFPDLAAIQQQFHHLLRTVPGEGLVVCNGEDQALRATLDMGCWTPCESFGLDATEAGWRAELQSVDGSRFTVRHANEVVASVDWNQIGRHNVSNALAAIVAARHAGVPPRVSAEALARFAGVKRRLEVRGQVGGITVYDDFAHHPTAIGATLQALRSRVGTARIVAVLEPRSNTMRMGLHKQELTDSLKDADRVFLFRPPDIEWSLDIVASGLNGNASIEDSIEALVTCLQGELVRGDHVLIMSNGGFGGLHDKLLHVLV